jgi:hypothetical protein
MAKQPKPPRGPRNLKAGGFTNGLWRLEERAARLAALRAERDRAAKNGDLAEALILNDKVKDFKSERTKAYWKYNDRRFGRRI